ncbi:hypothetical protein NIES22_67160 [Calothrix brevissima NIES-22]|nr:hypothetical protein NIES22_67160 [Calothrix brevissima NIES-22]
MLSRSPKAASLAIAHIAGQFELVVLAMNENLIHGSY